MILSPILRERPVESRSGHGKIYTHRFMVRKIPGLNLHPDVHIGASI